MLKTTRRVEGYDPERTLVAAIILRAVRDAKLGDCAAASWLTVDGAILAEDWLGMDASVVRHHTSLVASIEVTEMQIGI